MRQTKEAIETLLSEFQKSGTSITVFAKSKGINVSTLSYWLKKQNQNNEARSEKGFKQIEVYSQAGQNEIIYPNGVRLVLNQELTIHHLKELIQC